MSTEFTMAKAYEPSGLEEQLYAAWEASGAFNPDHLPDRNQQGEPYCILMPPPNRTGTLHMGHATMLAIEDVLARFHRMRGKKVLWIPGTDHAAIATQVKVEQLLIKEGIKDPRAELGREKFLERVVAFAEDSAKTINHQVRKMGSSCDWSRERYTFDAERNAAVNRVFAMMFEDGIIERGYRVVNWDPQFQTTLSDDELETKETTARLLTFKYDADFPIAISTTRPETKFGDTAVAVHPDDTRYQAFVGKTLDAVFCGKKIQIRVIADPAVDPAFGTGALGVTPAHSMIDAELAERHGLPTIPVIGRDGRLLLGAVPEAFVGCTLSDARKMIEEALQAQGLLQEVKEVPQALPIAQRGGAIVEQLPMKQWFVRVNKPFALRQDTLGKWKKGDQVTLKELMREAVASKQTSIVPDRQTSIVPDRFEKIYFHWIEHLRDWCISRQIWFGHRIPVWYRGDELRVSEGSPGEGWEQDPDTLDTWFSSGMWTFSALGWPNEETWNRHRAYHPTAVLETGYDILFFWVARMVLMATYAIGEVPFKDVYLHGLVRDEQGRKMSKSLGNVLDPLDLIPKYGTDAVRLSLMVGTTPGMDVKLSEQKIEGFRNFTNKVWNIARYILSTTNADAEPSTTTTLADRWLDARLATVTRSVTEKLERYQFSAAAEELRDFTWNDLADWYLEIAKVEGGKDARLRRTLQTVLALWHPFMPFVTEEIWKQAAPGSPFLMVTPWPVAEGRAEEPVFTALQSLVTEMRRLRAEQRVEPSRAIAFSIVCESELWSQLEENSAWIKRLVHAEAITRTSILPASWPVATQGATSVGFDPAGALDLAQEREKWKKELEVTVGYIASLEQKLANQEFTAKAPEKVIQGMREKHADAVAKRDTLRARLAEDS